MNPQGKYKKKFSYKKWYLSICAYFVIGVLIGGFSAWAIVSSAMEPTEPVEPTEPTVVVESLYGTIDGKHITEEVSLKWGSELEQGFVPLNVPMEEDMQEFIYCLSHAYSIEFPFVMAVIEHESSFIENAVSNTDDWGLMQINEINHEWLNKTLGVTDFLDPYQNVRSGVFILRQLFEKYDDPAKVLMAYNMGEGGASYLWDKGVYSTDYAEDILLQADRYTKEIQERMGEK
jgi:hypothetical protein